MRFYRSIKFGLAALISFAFSWLTPAYGADKIIVIGDSLSKEYAIEFPLLNPDNSAAWDERNWLEILAEHRPDQVDIGKLALWPDSRLTGHEYNFAFPGSTSSEWEEILTATIFTDPEYVVLRLVLDPYLRDEADRVVIFLGGNDLKNNYRSYYNGADSTSFANNLVSNLATIVAYVRDLNPTVPIVVVSMPDVGATPLVIEQYPDAAKRQIMTDLTRDINLRLRQWAIELEIGFADIEPLIRQLIDPERFVIGGVQFHKSIDPKPLSNDPEYLFSPDGFHPNTSPHLLIANEIIRAFEETYPKEIKISPFRPEEVLTILKIDPDVSPEQWSEAYGLSTFTSADDTDGDGIPLLQEFVFDLDPRVANSTNAPKGTWTGNQLELHYPVRVTESTHVSVTPEISVDFRTWEPIPSSQITIEEGISHVWTNLQGRQTFLRLHITEP